MNIPLMNVTSIEVVGFVTFFKDIRVEFNVTESSVAKPTPPLPKSPATPSSEGLSPASFKMPVAAKNGNGGNNNNNDDDDDDEIDDDEYMANVSDDGLSGELDKKGKKKKKGKHHHQGKKHARSSSTNTKKSGKSGSKGGSKTDSKRTSVNMGGKNRRTSTKYEEDDYENEDNEDKSEFDSVDYEDDNVLDGEEKGVVTSEVVIEKKVLSFGKFLNSMDEIVRLIVNETRMIGNKSIKSSL